MTYDIICKFANQSNTCELNIAYLNMTSKPYQIICCVPGIAVTPTLKTEAPNAKQARAYASCACRLDPQIQKFSAAKYRLAGTCQLFCRSRNTLTGQAELYHVTTFQLLNQNPLEKKLLIGTPHMLLCLGRNIQKNLVTKKCENPQHDS